MGESPLTRTTVNLSSKTMTALDVICREDGINRTDGINRALQFYGFMVAERVKGSDILLRHQDGTTERVHVL